VNSKSTLRKLWQGLISGILLPSLLSGCGGGSGGADRRVEISGFVSIDGTPLAGGMVSLVPIEGTEGSTATAAVELGVFSIPSKRGPLPGKYRVEIQEVNPQQPDPDDEAAALRYQEDVQAGKIRLTKLPAKFNIRSQLVKEIPAESHQDLIFELSTK